jgi:hypothetical protein
VLVETLQFRQCMVTPPVDQTAHVTGAIYSHCQVAIKVPHQNGPVLTMQVTLHVMAANRLDYAAAASNMGNPPSNLAQDVFHRDHMLHRGRELNSEPSSRKRAKASLRSGSGQGGGFCQTCKIDAR